VGEYCWYPTVHIATTSAAREFANDDRRIIVLQESSKPLGGRPAMTIDSNIEGKTLGALRVVVLKGGEEKIPRLHLRERTRLGIRVHTTPEESAIGDKRAVDTSIYERAAQVAGLLRQRYIGFQSCGCFF